MTIQIMPYLGIYFKFNFILNEKYTFYFVMFKKKMGGGG